MIHSPRSIAEASVLASFSVWHLQPLRQPQSDAQALSRPRGPDPLRTLFRQRFPAFEAAYEQRYATFFGAFRLSLISRATSAFRLCGDWSQGIARIAAAVLLGIQISGMRFRSVPTLLL